MFQTLSCSYSLTNHCSQHPLSMLSQQEQLCRMWGASYLPSWNFWFLIPRPLHRFLGHFGICMYNKSFLHNWNYGQLTVKWKCPWPMRCWLGGDGCAQKWGLQSPRAGFLALGEKSSQNPHYFQPVHQPHLGAFSLVRSSLMQLQWKSFYYDLFSLD